MASNVFERFRTIFSLSAALALSGCVTPPKPPPAIPSNVRNDVRISEVTVTNDGQYPVVGKVLKEEIAKAVVPIFKGRKPVLVQVTIDDFQMIDGGRAVLLGDAFILATYSVVVDSANGSVLGEYPINKLDVAAGLIGLMISDGSREEKARELSKDVAELLSKAMTGEK